MQVKRMNIQSFKELQSDPSLIEYKDHVCIFIEWHQVALDFFFHHIEAYRNIHHHLTDTSIARVGV